MKTIELNTASKELSKLCDDAGGDRVVLTRNGTPVAIVFGLDRYDAEDIGYMTDPDFWKMIQERRSDDSDLVSFEKVQAQLKADESDK